MKIAVITDVHGNAHALDAVLEDVAGEKPDVVVGAGDMVGCSAYVGAPEVWRRLHEEKIPFVIGNEEQRLLKYFSPEPDDLLKNSIQFWPLRYRAGQFTTEDVTRMKDLPVDYLIEGPCGNDVRVCHAAPGDPWHSPINGIDEAMEKRLNSVPEKVIAAGHYHTPWHLYWQEKLLVMAGSAGLPLRGKVDEVDYLMLTFEQQEWHFAYKSVKYNYAAAAAESAASSFLAEVGPVGWLMFDELLTQQDRLVTFLSEYCPGEKPADLEGWEALVREYLTSIDRWHFISSYL